MFFYITNGILCTSLVEFIKCNNICKIKHVNFFKLPADLRADAFSAYFHYAGRYRVVDGDVIHSVRQSLNPNFPGSEQLRHAELDGQTLVLSGKDEVGGVTRFHSLVWHKQPPQDEDLVGE